MTLNKPLKRFLDTNILVYSVDLSLPNRSKHRSTLEILRPSEQEILYISPQIIAEFYAVVTSAKSVVNPISLPEAIARIERLVQMPNMEVLPVPSDLFSLWLSLLKQHPVSGAKVFDLMHIATMLAYNITSIYTFNADDFNWCKEIQVIIPD